MKKKLTYLMNEEEVRDRATMCFQKELCFVSLKPLGKSDEHTIVEVDCRVGEVPVRLEYIRHGN